MTDEAVFETLSKINWLIRRQKYSIAEKMALELRSARPDLCNVYSCLVRIFFAQKKLDKAKVVLQQMLHICPDFPHSYYLFSAYYLQSKRFEQALEMAEKALRFEPENIDYQCHRSMILYNLRHFEDCKIACQNILSINAEHYSSLTMLAVCLSAQGQEERANQIFEDVQKQVPNYSELYACKGLVAMRKGDNEDAVKLFKEALRLNPTSPIATMNMEALKEEEPPELIKKMFTLWGAFNLRFLKFLPLIFVFMWAVGAFDYLGFLFLIVCGVWTVLLLIFVLYRMYKVAKNWIIRRW